MAAVQGGKASVIFPQAVTTMLAAVRLCDSDNVAVGSAVATMPHNFHSANSLSNWVVYSGTGTSLHKRAYTASKAWV